MGGQTRKLEFASVQLLISLQSSLSDYVLSSFSYTFNP